MKKLLLATTISAAFATALVFSQAHAAVDLDNEKDKASYSLGMLIGQSTANFGDLNFDALIEGLKQQHNGEETAMTLEEADATIKAFQQKVASEKAAAAAAEGEAYMAENKARDGVMVTDSGLQYEVLTEGDGPKPAVTDTVRVHYVGTLIDGTEFDSSVARGEPAEFGLNGVIPGWTEGLQLMNTGSKYRFVIPSDLAYGERGAGGAIGPGATLIFEVELLEIK
jgi:FKBP-type peptidyl-prolyl cis-trans isomerase